MRLVLASAMLIGGLAGWAVADAAYVVRPGEQAALMRFGQPQPSAGDVGPGLHFKTPFIEQAAVVSRGEQLVRLGQTEVQDARGAPVTLDGYMAVRVVDPAAYRARLGAETAAGMRLQAMLGDSLRQAVAQVSTQEIEGSGDPLAARALAHLRRAANAQRLGLEITDVQLTAVQPAGSEAEAAARRLQAAETLQAATLRADTDTHKRELIELADRDAAAVRAYGEQRALEIRGQGDAERAGVLAAAYGQDPDFARFFRRLEAYDAALDPQTTTVVISPDNAFMKLFDQGPAPARR